MCFFRQPICACLLNFLLCALFLSRVDAQVTQNHWVLEHIGDISSAALSTNGKSFLVSSSQGAVGAIDARSGNLTWRQLLPLRGHAPVAVISNALVVVFRRALDSKCEVRALAVETGILLWSLVLRTNSTKDGSVSISRAGSEAFIQCDDTIHFMDAKHSSPRTFVFPGDASQGTQHVHTTSGTALLARGGHSTRFFVQDEGAFRDRTKSFAGLDNSDFAVILPDWRSDSYSVCFLVESTVSCTDTSGNQRVLSTSALEIQATNHNDHNQAMLIQEASGTKAVTLVSGEYCFVSAGDARIVVAQLSSAPVLLKFGLSEIQVLHTNGMSPVAGASTKFPVNFAGAFVVPGPVGTRKALLRTLSQAADSTLTAFSLTLPMLDDHTTCLLEQDVQTPALEARHQWSRMEALASVSDIVAVTAPADLIAEHTGNSLTVSTSSENFGFVERLALQLQHVQAAVQTVSLQTASVLGQLAAQQAEARDEAAVDQLGIALCRGRGGVSVVHAFDLHSGRPRWTVADRQSAQTPTAHKLLAVKKISSSGTEPQIAVVQSFLRHSVVTWYGAWSGTELGAERVDFAASASSALRHKTATHDLGPVALFQHNKSSSAGTVVPANSKLPAKALAGTVLSSHTGGDAVGTIRGHTVETSVDSSSKLLLTPVWSSGISSHTWPAAVVSAGRQSQVAGVPLADDSLLVKYAAHRLIASISCTDAGVSARVLDAQSGRVLHSHFFEGRRGPLHAAQNEHTVYFSMWNMKRAQGELHAVSLFSGVVGRSELGPWPWQSQARGSAWFGLKPPTDPPVVKTASFVLPRAATGLQMSSTTNGLAQRFLLIATAAGDVWAVPDRMLDPRRPKKDVSAFEKASGLPRFDAIVPLQHHSSVFKTHSLAAAHTLVSFPCSMESCATVVVAGLDLAGCELWQTRPFDQLPSDFNSALLVALMAALATATWALKSRLGAQRLSSSWQ